MSDKLVIIPTYKEKENVANIINAIFDLDKNYHILIIDDNSPDGTADIVKSLIQQYPGKLFLEERTGKLGLGTAYIKGFKWGLERGYEYLIEMDADFSHDPTDLERLYLACKDGGADVAVGSRYVKGGRVENWPFSRILISMGGAMYTRMITWMPVKDPTAGFVCYRNKVLSTIDLDKIRFVGYAFQIEMKFMSWKLGFNIKEVYITFKDRIYGASKMSKGIIKEGIVGVLSMQLNSILHGVTRKQSIT
jgi:dolichol-phosphate mannosyltransferase